MFDRTPIGFCSRCDLLDIGDQAVSIRTIDAVEFFDCVQISQPVTIEDDVVAALDPWDAVDPEADRLVQGHRKIQKREGNDHRVDEGRRQDRQEACIHELAGQVGSKLAMRAKNLLLEDDATILQFVSKMLPSLLELFIEPVLQL
jgi:hypothetical protein